MWDFFRGPEYARSLGLYLLTVKPKNDFATDFALKQCVAHFLLEAQLYRNYGSMRPWGKRCLAWGRAGSTAGFIHNPGETSGGLNEILDDQVVALEGNMSRTLSRIKLTSCVARFQMCSRMICSVQEWFVLFSHDPSMICLWADLGPGIFSSVVCGAVTLWIGCSNGTLGEAREAMRFF
jgi:hypothetical protein